MSRMVGTVSMGIRAPIIRSGDDLVEIVTNSVLETVKDGALTIRDRDVIAMTEAIVARAQGNYASVDDIAADVRAKLGGETVGVLFPILSRNRFAICLRGIAKGAKKVVLMLSYPSDEVGNHLIDVDAMDEKGVDPYKDVLTLERYRELFGYTVHPFTGVDYVDYYSNLIRESGAEVEVIFANDPRAILPYTKNVLACDIHTRARTKRRLLAAGAEKVFCLDEIMTRLHRRQRLQRQVRIAGLQQVHRGQGEALSPGVPGSGGGHSGPHPEGERQARGGHGLRRRRLQGPRGQDLGAG